MRRNFYLFNAIEYLSDRPRIWFISQSALKVLESVFSTQNEPETYLQLYLTTKIEVSKSTEFLSLNCRPAFAQTASPKLVLESLLRSL